MRVALEDNEPSKMPLLETDWSDLGEREGHSEIIGGGNLLTRGKVGRGVHSGPRLK